MRATLLILSLLLSFTKVTSQINPNDVLGSDNFKIKESKYYDTSYGLYPIVNSSYEIEIRLYEYEMMGSRCQILCFDGNKWTGKTMGIIRYAQESQKVLKPGLNFNNILDSLLKNNIFKLPDQSKLNLKGDNTNGANYTISYKVGNKMRSYDFSNPKYYLKMNKGYKELENYIAIVGLFNSIYILR